MNVIISGGTPNPVGAAVTRTSAAVRPADLAPAAKPAATVEISSDARRAYSAGQGHGAEHKRHPLNIIWGNSPR